MYIECHKVNSITEIDEMEKQWTTQYTHKVKSTQDNSFAMFRDNNNNDNNNDNNENNGVRKRAQSGGGGTILQFIIKDTGNGIAAKCLPVLFDPFYQVCKVLL